MAQSPVIDKNIGTCLLREIDSGEHQSRMRWDILRTTYVRLLLFDVADQSVPLINSRRGGQSVRRGCLLVKRLHLNQRAVSSISIIHWTIDLDGGNRGNRLVRWSEYTYYTYFCVRKAGSGRSIMSPSYQYPILLFLMRLRSRQFQESRSRGRMMAFTMMCQLLPPSSHALIFSWS